MSPIETKPFFMAFGRTGAKRSTAQDPYFNEPGHESWGPWDPAAEFDGWFMADGTLWLT
jgi:hypothetical protein